MRQRDTTFLIEMDQTISARHVGRDLAESVAYYRERGVVVPDSVACYSDLFQLPAVLAQYEKLPGALAGVHQLARHGEIVYVSTSIRAPNTESITRGWLWEQGFPSPDQLILCQGVAQKLLTLSERPGSLILVDAHWRQLLEAWPRLVNRAPAAAADLSQRLTLVAFHATASERPASSVVPVVPLPAWASVLTTLYEMLPVSCGTAP